MAINVIRGDSSLENLKPPKRGRKEFRVEGVPGLFLRVSPAKKVWYFRSRLQGEKNPRWLKIGVYKPGELADVDSAGCTFEQAKAKADKLRDMIACGINPKAQAELDQETNFKAVAALFLKRGAKVNGKPWKPLTATAYRLALESDRLNSWHDVPVADIGYPMVRGVIRQMERESKHTHAKRTLAYLKSFFKWCRNAEYLPRNQPLPTDDIALDKSSDNARNRWLNEAEIALFWQATALLEYPWRQYYRLLLLTGQRCSNVTSIQRKDIKTVKRKQKTSGKFKGFEVWHQPDNKAGREFLLPLNKLIKDALKDCPNLGHWYLSTTGDKPINQSSKIKKKLDEHIAALKEKHNLKDVFDEPWSNHDLRRTVATHLRGALGFDKDMSMAILNHAPQGVHSKHYDMSDLLLQKQEVMSEWGDYITGLIKPKRGKVASIAKLRT